jgi:hypothetical protein
MPVLARRMSLSAGYDVLPLARRILCKQYEAQLEPMGASLAICWIKS